MLYLCPDCHAAHDEPLEAMPGLHVPCPDCLLEREIAAARVDPALLIPRAA
jgi:hypothetical protein